MDGEANREQPARIAIINHHTSGKVTRESPCCPGVDEPDMAMAGESERESPLRPHSFWKEGVIATDLSSKLRWFNVAVGKSPVF